jgi:MFS family permease
LAWIAILIVLVFTSLEEAALPMFIYMLAMAIAGFIINFIARKTNNKKAKIIAGIVYILGLVVIPAILCFISCKDNRKLPDVEEKEIQS